MSFQPYREWPQVRYDPLAVHELQDSPEVPWGIDFEWNIQTNEPTLLSLSDGVTTVSGGHQNILRELQPHSLNRPLVGHNLKDADLPILKGKGFTLNESAVMDTMVMWYLTESHLCKSSRKANDEEQRGAGYMNMWAMCSVHTDLPCWKYCPGPKVCESEYRPCPVHQPKFYNGLDSLAPVLALPSLWLRVQALDLEKLYSMHLKFMGHLHEIREHGIRVDVPYTRTLQSTFEAAKQAELERLTALGFNPESPKQILAFFKERGVQLDNAQEQTIKDALAESEDPILEALLEYKELGDGSDRWFAPREWNSEVEKWQGFVYDDGRIRPRIGPLTSTGRLQCTNPNLQNISKRRKTKSGESMGDIVRRAILPDEGDDLWAADYSNAENRAYMAIAGYPALPEASDMHAETAAKMGLRDDDRLGLIQGGARQSAKTMAHAANNGEGFKLVTPEQLRSPKLQREIAMGARIVYPDWKFEGKVVTFTGINLADRLFGEATLANRASALNFHREYFRVYGRILQAHRRILAEVERTRSVRTSLGYYMASYGREDDRCKTALSLWPQQIIAHLTKLAIINACEDGRIRVLGQVHDELLFSVPKRHNPRNVVKWIREYMVDRQPEQVPEIPNLFVPCDIAKGLNWAQKTKVWKGGKYLL